MVKVWSDDPGPPVLLRELRSPHPVVLLPGLRVPLVRALLLLLLLEDAVGVGGAPPALLRPVKGVLVAPGRPPRSSGASGPCTDAPAPLPSRRPRGGPYPQGPVPTVGTLKAAKPPDRGFKSLKPRSGGRSSAPASPEPPRARSPRRAEPRARASLAGARRRRGGRLGRGGAAPGAEGRDAGGPGSVRQAPQGRQARLPAGVRAWFGGRRGIRGRARPSAGFKVEVFVKGLPWLRYPPTAQSRRGSRACGPGQRCRGPELIALCRC